MLKKLLILVLLPFFLCSCTNRHENEIVFSSWGSVTEVKIIKQIISDFEKENPDIKVSFMHIPQNYFQKLHLLFASNQAPDLLFINNLYLPVYAEHLEDLSSYINSSEFYPQSIEALSADNKILAIPRDVSVLLFYRNKALTQNTPKNMEDFLNAVKGIKPYGVSWEPDLYFMLPYVITLGDDFHTPKKSLVFYKNLAGSYAPAPYQTGSSTQAQMFLDGKTGFYLSGRWMYPKISEKANFDWDVITFPGTVSLDASGWAVSKNSKHKKEALKLAEYLSSPAGSEYFLQTGLIVPARKETAQKIDNKVFLDAVSKSRVLKFDKGYKKLADKINKELSN